MASSTTGRVEVFVAMTVWSLQTRSSSWKRCFFTAMSSTTDSITRSHSASSARSEVAVTLLSAESRSASWMRPLSTCLARDFSRPARVESAVDCDLERRTTSKPCRAAHSAMPDPMIPDPTMPRRVTDMAPMLPVSSLRAPGRHEAPGRRLVPVGSVDPEGSSEVVPTVRLPNPWTLILVKARA